MALVFSMNEYELAKEYLKLKHFLSDTDDIRWTAFLAGYRKALEFKPDLTKEGTYEPNTTD